MSISYDDLPEGLRNNNGKIECECRRCGNWYEWPVDVADYVEDDYSNLCGGSPWCCP